MAKLLEEVESNTLNYNSAKELVLNRLYMDKVITDEQRLKYIENWNIIVIKKSWFMKWANKFSNTNKEDYILKYVRFED